MIRKHKHYNPKIGKNVFVAKSADVIGKVELKTDSSVWFNSVLRADCNDIIIGEGTNIQDLVCIHVSEEHPTIIGKGVTVGHSAIVHACSIDDYSLIGMGATILDGSKIGKYCIIGANSLVTNDSIIPDGSLCFGSPAKVVRSLTEEEKRFLEESALSYIKEAKDFMEDGYEG